MHKSFMSSLSDLLLKEPNLVHKRSFDGMAAFMSAASRGGHLTCLKLLVEKGVDVTARLDGCHVKAT